MQDKIFSLKLALRYVSLS